MRRLDAISNARLTVCRQTSEILQRLVTFCQLHILVAVLIVLLHPLVIAGFGGAQGEWKRAEWQNLRKPLRR